MARLTVPSIMGSRVESVRIKCSLAVCQRDCPVITCDRENQPISVQDSVVLETRALFARKEIMNSVEEVEHELYLAKDDIQDDTAESTLCLSPTRLVLAFGVLITVMIASLLLSCYLWMKARKKMMPRPRMGPIPIQRGPYMMPGTRPRPAPYIRVLT